MQKYLDLISSLIEKQEEPCFLPGIGILKFREEAAEVNYGEQLLYPPHTYIVFEKTANPAPPFHSVIDTMREAFHLNEEKAQEEWNETIAYINKKLSEKGEVKISGTGKFILNERQELVFVESPEKYSLYPSAPYAGAGKTGEPTPEEPFFEESSGNKTRVWLIALGIIILAGAGFFFFKYQDILLPNKEKKQASSENTSPDSLFRSQQTLTDDSIRRQNTESPAATVQSKPDSIHFAVIYAVYPSQKVANKHYNQMHSWGHDVSIFQKDSAHYQMGYSYYERPEDTAKRLEEIKKLYGGNPFLIYPEK